MVDNFGRKIEYLRISVTQRCNLKCLYCSPEDCGGWDRAQERLTGADYKRIVGIMASLGIKKVRLTGGEPLLRPDICGIISAVSSTPGIRDLAMTTNGVLLEDMAQELRRAGLMRLNVSLDSLDEKRYEYITGANVLKKVLRGIEKAVGAGMLPLRINTVLVRGLNDSETEDLMRLAKDMPVDIRFIELMPVGAFGEDNQERVVFNSDIISAHRSLIPFISEDPCQPAEYYRLEGYRGKIGFISPMSHKFCDRCNRIRLTSDGKIRPCLGSDKETDLTAALGDPELMGLLIRNAVLYKPGGHNFGMYCSSGRKMYQIGG